MLPVFLLINVAYQALQKFTATITILLNPVLKIKCNGLIGLKRIKIKAQKRERCCNCNTFQTRWL